MTAIKADAFVYDETMDRYGYVQSECDYEANHWWLGTETGYADDTSWRVDAADLKLVEEVGDSKEAKRAFRDALLDGSEPDLAAEIALSIDEMWAEIES